MMKNIYSFLILFLPVFAFTQSWKAEAEAAIQEHRTATVKVNFEGIENTDVKVNLKMREHAFKWGTTVSITEVFDLEQRGFDKHSDHPYYNHFRHFNSVTPENAGKWKGWLNAATRAKYLEMAAWFNDIGIANRGHTTIWSSITRWNAVPGFVVNADSPEEIRLHIQQHIESQLPILESYGVYEMDLINELINEAEIVKNLLNLPPAQRPIEHAQWHKWAKAAAPEMDLVVNEYDLFQSGNDFYVRYVDYVQDMIAAGAPVDVVGMQGHFFGGMPNYEELKRRLDQVAVLGLPMSVTEFDMQGQSYDDMERVLYAVFSEPLVHGFSLWGAWDGRQWRNNAAMFREDWTLKASGQAWFDLVKEAWWTDETATLNSSSNFETNAFLGTYDLYVEVDGKVIARSFELDSENQEITINLNEEGYALPNATLNFENNKTTIFVNEPLRLSIDSDTPIEQVTFKDGDRILAVDSSEYIFSSTRAGTFDINAVIEFENGYRLETPIQSLEVSAANAAPVIQNIFPPTGSSLLQQANLDLFIDANDPNGDPIIATIYDENDNVLASSSIVPFYFSLNNLPLGSNTLRIRIEDDKFGFNERQLILNIIDPNSPNLTTAQPLAEDDDIEEKEDRSIDVTGDLDLGEKVTGIRFEFASIPAGAIIDSAFIQFSSQKADQTGACELIFRAEKETNARPFNSISNNISNRQLTQANTSWQVPDWVNIGDKNATQRSPDLSPIFTELVNLDDWSNQSPVNIIVGIGNSPSKRSAFSYDQSPDDAPELQVHYRINFDLAAPPAPDGLFYQTFGGGTGQLTWETPISEDILGYIIFVEGFENPIFVEDPTHLFLALEEGEEYVIQVQAIGAFGLKSPLSEPFIFRSDQSTNTDDFLDNNAFALFPNPANDQVFVQTEYLAFHLQLIDSQGKIIRESRNETQMDVSNLNAGLYFLRLWNSVITEVKHLIIAK